MTGDNRNQEIETGVIILGAAYFAAILTLIFWIGG
jgi:hypothetical protein